MLAPNQQSFNLNAELIRPIVFLDLFSYPVTTYEIWQFLDRKFNLDELIDALNDLQIKQVLAFKAGFYFLPGQEHLIHERSARHNYTCHKLKIAKRFSRLFSMLPGIQLVAAANLIGGYNLRLESDIDIFIITKPGRLWLSRLFCAGLAKLLHSRPTKKTKKNKICLSFYVTTDALNLKELELKDGDPYFYYWKKGLICLYERKDTWINFLQANQLFIFDQNKAKGVLPAKTKLANEALIDFFENIAKKFQLLVMSKSLRSALLEGKGVLITDNVLKLYLQDRRMEFFNKFNSKMHEVSQKNY